MATQRSGGPARRSPGAGARKRDPERTRERILSAALVEFGEHGYAGARIAAIADRAGVNQQLISYYFDGKAGLYGALSERWRQVSAELDTAEQPIADVVVNFMRAGTEQRSWTRLLAWEGLTGVAGDPADAAAANPADAADAADAADPADAVDPADAAGAGPAAGTEGEDGSEDAFFAGMVADLRRRQAAGELADDLDPGYVLLVFFAAAMAPVILPQVSRRITGLASDSPDFTATYAEQLRRMLARLAGPA